MLSFLPDPNVEINPVDLPIQMSALYYLGKMGQRLEAHIKQQNLTLPDNIHNKQGGEFA